MIERAFRRFFYQVAFADGRAETSRLNAQSASGTL